MSILVFSAHALDYLWRTGGTIARYTKAGEEVHIVCMTYGERGESHSLWSDDSVNTDVERIKMIRRAESEAAAKVLGASVEFLDYNDNPMEITKERCIEMVRCLRQIKPRIVITHQAVSNTNPDHFEAGYHTFRAIRYASLPGVDPESGTMPRPQVFLFEQSNPEADKFHPQVFVDITDVMEIKQEAMKQVPTQAALSEDYTEKAKYRGRMAREIYGDKKIRYAEAFEMPTPFVGTALPEVIR